MRKYEVEFVEHGSDDRFTVVILAKDNEEAISKAGEIEKRLHWHEYFNEVSSEWDETSWSKYVKEINDTGRQPYVPDYQVKS